MRQSKVLSENELVKLLANLLSGARPLQILITIPTDVEEGNFQGIIDSNFNINVVNKVQDSVKSETRTVVKEQNLEMEVVTVLRGMGISAHLKGYTYLREAIKAVVNDISLLDSVTKLLYPCIARRFGTKASCVERAIRHAIESAWLLKDMSKYGAIWNELNVGQTRPTNSEIIAIIADEIRINYKASA